MADLPEETQIKLKIHQSSEIGRGHPLFALHERMVGGRIANAKANAQKLDRKAIQEGTKQLLFSLVRLVRQAFEEEECRQKRAYEQDKHRRARISPDDQRIERFENLIRALEDAIPLLPEIEIPIESAVGHVFNPQGITEDPNPDRTLRNKLRTLTDRYFESTFDSALQSAMTIREILKVMPGRAKARSEEPLKEALKFALAGYTAFSTQAPGCLGAYGTKGECTEREFCEIVMKAAGIEVPHDFGGQEAFRKRVSRLDTN